MCSIITFTKDMYSDDLADHLISDMTSNPDGFSVLLVDNEGTVLVDLHSMDNFAVIGLLDWATYARAFVHCRLSTQGSVTVRNTHGFFANGIYYQHNGILSDQASKRFAVDSMLIGAKITEGSLHSTLNWLRTQSYANCFFIDTNTKQYFVTRNSVGTLYTDGKGNYATNVFQEICHPVVNYSEHSYRFDSPIVSVVAPLNYEFNRFNIETDDETEEYSADTLERMDYLDDRTDHYDFNSVNDLMELEDRRALKQLKKRRKHA